MKNNRINKISISRLLIIIVTLVVVLVGGTFAWYTYSSKKSALVLTIDGVNNTRITLSPYQINASMTPVTSYTSGVYSDVYVVNSGDSSTPVTLYYKINELDQNLIDNGLQYTITSSSTEDGTYSLVSSGDFTEAVVGEDFLILETEIETSSEIYYKVYLWVEDLDQDQSVIQNSVLDLELYGSLGISTLYLFDNGELYTNVTGGWTNSGWTYTDHTVSSNASAGTVLSASLSNSTYSVAAIGTVNKINLTNYDTLHFTVDKAAGGGGVFISSTKALFSAELNWYHVPYDYDFSGNKTIDISSLEGSYYVAVLVLGSSSHKYPSIKVSNIYAE